MVSQVALQAGKLKFKLVPSSRIIDARWILTLGFGGLLALMAYIGIDSVRNLSGIRQNNDRIRRAHMARNRSLDQIRSNVYLSGTLVRDYLLEPDASVANRNRQSLEKTRREMSTALDAYARLAPPNQVHPLEALRQQLGRYWDLLEPVTKWGAEQRRQAGYAFLRDEVFPRRTAMLGIADQINVLNEEQLTLGDEMVVSLFEEFQRRLVITLTVTLLVGSVLAAVSMRRILVLERQAAARYAEVRELSIRLVEAQENERRAISRELHDEVGQSLSAVLIGLGNLSAMLPAEAKEQVVSLRTLAENSVRAVRNMALLLRPSMLDDLGLVPALEWQAREVQRLSRLRVKVIAQNVPDDMPEEHKTCVYRIVQEALNNCMRHADAENVEVTVKEEPGRLLLRVQDDGKGFAPAQHKGMGLVGIQERVANLKGHFRVDSAPGRGTLLAVELPYPA